MAQTDSDWQQVQTAPPISDWQPVKPATSALVPPIPKSPGSLETFGEHTATGIAPGAAFALAAPSGAKYGAALGAMIPGADATGIPEAVGAFLGGLITGGVASWGAYKAQHATLKAAAPKFTDEMDKRLQAGADAHPFAAVAGDVAGNIPSMELSLPKLAQLPMRAALGGTIGGVLPLAQGRKPTLEDVAGGAASAALLGEPRFGKVKPTTIGDSDAIRQQETGTVLQRQQGQIGETGGGRGGVEQVQQGKTPANAPPQENAEIQKAAQNENARQPVAQPVPPLKAGTADAVLSRGQGKTSPSEIAAMPEDEYQKLNRSKTDDGSQAFLLTADATQWAMENPDASIPDLEKLRAQHVADQEASGYKLLDRSQWFSDAIHALKGDEVGKKNIDTINREASKVPDKIASQVGGLKFKASGLGRWTFDLTDEGAAKGQTITVKQGATPSEIAAKKQAAIDSYKEPEPTLESSEPIDPQSGTPIPKGGKKLVPKVPAQRMTAMGADVHGDQSLPTIEDQISGKPLAPKRDTKPSPAVEPQNKSTLNSLSDVVKNAVTSTKGFLGGLAGKTFPKTTLISKQLGELGARWISSKIAARPKAEIYVAEVLGNSGLKSSDVGAALTEDNLRSIKKTFGDKGDQESADKVQTLIGKKGSPFKTERDYQDFLSDPRFKEVVERHKDMWKSTVEPQYIAAMRLDPDTELPSRGLQTGARVNLRAVQEGENPQNVVRTTSQGNLLNTLRKKSPFGIQATGTGEAYHTDLHDLMENTFGRQDEIANKNEFEKALVESGNAVEGKPGQEVNIEGRKAVGFPLQRKTVIVDGKPVAQNRTLYVNPKIASEYRIGANVDFTPSKGIFSKVTQLMNQSAIASATEASTHVMNLGSALFALPATSGKLLNDAFLTSFGRADIPVKIVQTITKSMQDNRAQIAGLSEIGAMRDYHEPTKIPVMRQASQLIQWMDKNTRLVLDDAYQRMKAQGLVDPSETARREFVNQVGQYNSRAQPYLMGQMRKLGISPFVTAGKNFNTLGIREATLNPGVKATSNTAALALRANMLSKWIGTAALIATTNYLLTKDKGGGVMGRKGTPLGYIDTGTKDKNGRNVIINVLGITGQGRALRVTGAKGFIDSERMGLDSHTAADTASRDMINAAISPWAGPLPRFAFGAASGYPTAVNVGREFPVVPPGTSQHISDFKNSVLQMNPVVAGIHQAMQPNSSGWLDAVRSQFPRLVPQSDRADSMTANYPEIVQKAQANDFVNYVVHAARTVPMAYRRQFTESQIQRLPPALQEKARQEMNYRKVFSQ